MFRIRYEHINSHTQRKGINLSVKKTRKLFALFVNELWCGQFEVFISRLLKLKNVEGM